MPYKTAPLVDHAVRRVSWLDARRFWYVDHDSERRSLPGDDGSGRQGGSPVRSAKARRRARPKASGKPVDAAKLAITAVRIERRGAVRDHHDGKRYLCDLTRAAGQCVR